jgi:hypothetical protein
MERGVIVNENGEPWHQYLPRFKKRVSHALVFSNIISNVPIYSMMMVMKARSRIVMHDSADDQSWSNVAREIASNDPARFDSSSRKKRNC